jgi:hypothetical protein
MKKQDKLPVYEVLIDENDDITGVDLISLVENPAIEVRGVAFSDQKCGCGNKEEYVNPRKGETEREFINRCVPLLIDEGKPQDQSIAICYSLWDEKMANVEMADEDVPVVGGIKTHYNCRCKIENGRWETHPEKSKSGEVCEFCLAAQKRYNRGLPSGSRFSALKESQEIAGPFLIPDLKIYRVDEATGEEYEVYFSADTIEKIRNKFMKKVGNLAVNLEHTEEMVPGFINESWIITDPKNDKSRTWGFDLPVGTWFGKVKVEDTNFWNEVVKGEDKKGFSVEGFLNYQLVQMGKLRKLSAEEVIDMMTEGDLLELI